MKSTRSNGLFVALGLLPPMPAATATLSLETNLSTQVAELPRFRLPRRVFSTSVATGLASPIVGLATPILFHISTRRRDATHAASSNLRPTTALIAASIVAILPPTLWLFTAGTVFFAAGGSR